jgi:nicotinate phosphoribosyltransferase
MQDARIRSLFISDENLGMLTDLYQLTMAAAYFQTGLDAEATFELFVRELPPQRSYLIIAGLEQVVHYLTKIGFKGNQIEYLKNQPFFKKVDPRFFDYLAEFKFTGNLMAIPEGTIAFAQEPILQVTAPIIQAQIVETYLLATINFQTCIATKAGRIVLASKGKKVIDFGTRRAHGAQAGVLAARAAFIGGCVGTSNVLAGFELGIPIMGTAAHSFTMAFESERQAFHNYHRVYPDHTILLIDTYDTIQGAKNAISIGPGLKGVRLDSGDLLRLSRRVRRLLDEAQCRDAQIVASGDLNEYKIEKLLKDGAPIDIFGVGTEMVTSRDAPALGGVYKLVQLRRMKDITGKIKTSPGKATLPYRKQVFRTFDRRGKFKADTVTVEGDLLDGEPLLKQIIKDGKLTGPLPEIIDIQNRAIDQLHRLPDRYKRLSRPERYPVRFTQKLAKMP